MFHPEGAEYEQWPRAANGVLAELGRRRTQITTLVLVCGGPARDSATGTIAQVDDRGFFAAHWPACREGFYVNFLADDEEARPLAGREQ
jgi:hypothetical protein